MRRYYFDLHEPGSIDIDDEGSEYADPAAALRIAQEIARDAMADAVRRGVVSLDSRVDVRDEDGAIVGRVRFADAVRMLN